MNLAFIPVRGGSKSIPFKNIKDFCGKPLLFWTAEALQKSTSIDKIIVATDHVDIKKAAKSFGFDKLEVYDRESINANDTASTEAVMLEFLSKTKFDREDIFCLVQATNPFITSLNIDEAFSQLKFDNADSLLSVVLTKRFFWNKNGQPLNYDYNHRPRRQSFEGVFMENGAFYISKMENIISNRNRISGKISLYEMPDFSGVEIDEEDDWMIAEKLFKKYILKKNTLKSIKLFLCDVDGVMTDAGMYYAESGDEFKKFNTHDGMAFELLRRAGIKTGIITSENTKIVEQRAIKLKVDFLYQGKRDGGKLATALEICNKENISLDEVAYIGDDINCYELLCKVGLSACPANAVEKIKEIPNIVLLGKSGGDGAVREFVEKIL